MIKKLPNILTSIRIVLSVSMFFLINIPILFVVLYLICGATDVSAETIDVPITEVVDILFEGGGVYGWTIDSLLKIYLETSTPCDVKSVAAFSTSAAMNATDKIAEIVKTKGIDVCKEKLPTKRANKIIKCLAARVILRC